MSAVLMGTAVLAALAGGAAGAPASDIYITGKVLGRVPGKNLSSVEITWAYKCLGDKLGDATYQWTLKVVRRLPLPQRTATLQEGTSKRGSTRTVLSPGTYLPIGDPFSCETDRGAGYERPEIGAQFVVPDYCAWAVTAAKGSVGLEHGIAVKAATPGAAAAVGDALTTSRGAKASLDALAGDGLAALGASSRLEIAASACATKGGWNLRLAEGSVMLSALGPRGLRRVSTANATASAAAAARWQVALAGKTTTVRALAGKVTVAGLKGAPVVLKAGRSTKVVGSAAPTRP